MHVYPFKAGVNLISGKCPDLPANRPPIVQALCYGLSAPSAHNTQPWRIEILSDTEALIFCDPARTLPFTDPPGRQIHISHGTLIEATAIAATALGCRVEVEVLPEGEMDFEGFGTKPTARLTLFHDSTIKQDPFFERLLHRCSSRKRHLGPRLTETETHAIGEAGTRPGLSVDWIAEYLLPDAMDIIERAMAVEVNDQELYGETLTWFRFSRSEIGKRRDGLNLFTSGLTGLPLLWARMTVGRRTFQLGINRKLFLRDFNKTIRSTSGLMTIVTPGNSMADWINTGRGYLRAQLAADTMGFRFHPVSQSLQEFKKMNDLRVKMDRLIGVTSPAKLQMLVRVGRTDAPAQSPRRTLSDVSTLRTDLGV